MSFDPDLIQNYQDLAESRGWSVEQMADHLETADASLAAELRRQVAERTPEQSSTPKGRRQPSRSKG